MTCFQSLTTIGTSRRFDAGMCLMAEYTVCALTGARNDVYDAGMEIPPGRNRPPAPSRHSGQSSLSPNDPSSSLTCSSRANQWHVSRVACSHFRHKCSYAHLNNPTC